MRPMVDAVPFDADTAVSADVAVVTVRGEIDLATADDLTKAILQGGDRAGSVVVDLSPLDFLDSSGVRAIVHAARGVQRLRVVCPPANRAVRRVLDVVGMDSLVPVLDALPEADG